MINTPIASSRFTMFEPTLIDVIRSHARWRPDTVALVAGTKRVTWGALWSRVRRLARALQHRGAECGNVVAVLGGNTIETLIAYLGAVASGGVVSPLSNQIPADALVRMVDDARASVLIADEDGRNLLGPIPASWKDRIERVAAEPADHAEDWISMGELVAGDDGAEPKGPIPPEAHFSLTYTSGTTGNPKGMVHTHRARLAFAARFAHAFSMRRDSIAVAVTPIFTAGTWLMMLPALYAGASTVILPSFSAEEFQHAVASERATHTFLVPTAYAALLDHPAFDPSAFGSMRTWVSAGSALAVRLKRRLDELPGELLELYGCSEGFTTISGRADRAAANDLSAVGAPPFGWEIRVVGDDDREAAPGGIGELVGVSEFMLSHYHEKPIETEQAIWRDDLGRTFIRSGDLGRLGADGQFYVIDRKKDVINSGGMKIFASDLESILLARPEISEAAVVAATHPKWGETPVALIVPRDRNTALDTEAIRAAVNDRVAKYQRLSRLIVVPELPRNALGKVIKRQLRDSLSKDAETDSAPQDRA